MVNVNEVATTSAAKFGNGIIKEGEDEQIRIWIEICNENGGRKVIPFNSMLPGDAYLWSKFRDDEEMLEKFKKFTQNEYSIHRGYYGKIGDRTIIKNTRIIKDVWIGTDAYIKGANKLKNLTINSSAEAACQIGEGCELVNGIVGFGCRVFYGVKAVRFVMASHSQLKYGARLINSYLGNNSTISCCEVLNSLIFPSHEQHHNNSFLCAATLMGQTNMAAGATIGSNHNSRSPDGEILAGRGFWPGLCVSLKHNSKFACFNILAKGDYPWELNIPFPFSLVSNDVARDQLVVMPAYWFLYNLYAISRNEWKYNERDQRIEKTQRLEFSALAPDTINEMFTSLELMESCAGRAWLKIQNPEREFTPKEYIKTGKAILNAPDPLLHDMEILAPGLENSDRKATLIKVPQAYQCFVELIVYYGVTQLIDHISRNKIKSHPELMLSLPNKRKRADWMNVGGQLIRKEEIERLRNHIRSGKINSWTQVHDFYKTQGAKYEEDKFAHSFASLLEILNISKADLSAAFLANLLKDAVHTKSWITEGIYESRAKDYSNPFRQMVYDTSQEMDEVLGKLENNSFIKLQNKELESFKKKVNSLLRLLK